MSLNYLVTNQNPLPRLLLGWSLSSFYSWITPEGKRTHEFICLEEIWAYWTCGYLMKSVDGRIVLTEEGKKKAAQNAH